jgi:hypothetical protein
MAKLYDVRKLQGVAVSVQLVPNKPEIIAAQAQFGWVLDHVWTEQRYKSKTEQAVLIRVLNAEPDANDHFEPVPPMDPESYSGEPS